VAGTRRPVLYGADYSVYVRIARLALIEKGGDHDRVDVDIFAADGIPVWYLDLHPFGRIPAFADGGFHLYETAAIARYVDEAYEGPALQPGDARGRATMAQIIGLLDAYAYRSMVWDVAVERLERTAPNEALIAAGLDKAAAALGALSALKVPGPWLLGEQLTLADLHAGPIVGYFLKAPEGRALLPRFPDIESWWMRLSRRDSFIQTEKTA
jgi:glutathione S-transferase